MVRIIGAGMAVLKLEQRVKANPEMVWRTIADIGGLAEVSPHVSQVEILEGQGLGMKRRVYDLKGESWIEECVAWDEGQSYTMRVDTSKYPFPFARMSYTWGLQRESGGVVIRMLVDYVPRFGLLGELLEHARLATRFRTRFEETCEQIMDGWLRLIYAREWAYQITVATILDEKGYDVATVSPATTVAECARILHARRIGTVLVLDEAEHIAGLVSERDIVRNLGAAGDALLERPCADIMTARVTVCHPDDNMLSVMSCMSERRFRHLPVVDDADKLLGIISIGDVIKTRLQELEAESETLHRYIEARRWRELYMELGPAALAQESVALDVEAPRGNVGH